MTRKTAFRGAQPSPAELVQMAREWAETDALYLHIAICLLAGEWTSCERCRPLIWALWAPAKKYAQRRKRSRKRAMQSAKVGAAPHSPEET